MRAFPVVALDEGIEPGLLLQNVAGGGLGGFLLQREMHPLVSAVLFWMPRFDSLDLDAHLRTTARRRNRLSPIELDSRAPAH